MNMITLVPVGEIDRRHLESVAGGLTSILRVVCVISSSRLDAAFALDSLRGQYHSTEILKRLLKPVGNESWRVLGVTEADLYIPILTFVFGEAQLGPLPRAAAVVSIHRLRQEFYGMPPDGELLAERLLKEALHELGHTLGLRHCHDYQCVMSSSHGVDRIDLKQAQFCPDCAAALSLHDTPPPLTATNSLDSL
jgi:archaemetzincin